MALVFLGPHDCAGFLTGPWACGQCAARGKKPEETGKASRRATGFLGLLSSGYELPFRSGRYARAIRAQENRGESGFGGRRERDAIR